MLKLLNALKIGRETKIAIASNVWHFVFQLRIHDSSKTSF